MFAPREFEWDEAKEARNFAKQLFTDILGVFSDPARVDYDVSRPEEGEFRRKTVGRIGRDYVRRPLSEHSRHARVENLGHRSCAVQVATETAPANANP